MGRENQFRLSTLELEAESVGQAYLIKAPTEVETRFAIDYSAKDKRSLLEELFRTGTVSSIEWPLAETTDFGPETRSSPAFLFRDGTYYRIWIEESEMIEREWWTFGLDLIDGTPPEDATVATEPFETVSSLDAEIVTKALRYVQANRTNPIDRRDMTFDSRAVWFHDRLDSGESESW
ncbi:MAG: hypothetical protein ACI9PP_000303 [Halobacteriales archaeon]